MSRFATKWPLTLSVTCGYNRQYLPCSKSMIIREATEKDFEEIWPIFHEIANAGETYAYPRNTTKHEAEKLWMELPQKTFVVEQDSKILGTYYIKTNQQGPGSHVCNCG